MMSFLFGIPLSLIAVVAGAVLGIGSRWGILRHWWVTVKLVALVAVMAVGALVVGPAEGRLTDAPTDASPNVIVIGAVIQATLLVGAAALSVFKPRRRRGTAGRRAVPARSRRVLVLADLVDRRGRRQKDPQPDGRAVSHWAQQAST